MSNALILCSLIIGGVLGSLALALAANYALLNVIAFAIALVIGILLIRTPLPIALGLTLGLAAFQGWIRWYTDTPIWSLLVVDSALAIVYFRWFRSRGRSLSALMRIPFAILILAYLSLNLIQIFNPNAISIIVGLGGVKQRLFAIPLFFMAYELLANSSSARKALSSFIVLTTVVSGIMVLQFIVSGAQDTLDTERLQDFHIPVYSEIFFQSELVYSVFVIKPIGPTTGFGVAGELVLVGILAILSRLSFRPGLGMLLLYVCLGIHAIAMLALFSRAYWLMAVVGAAAIIIMRRSPGAALPSLVGGLIALQVVVAATSGFALERLAEARNPIQVYQRLRLHDAMEIFSVMQKAPFGIGLQGAVASPGQYAALFAGYQYIYSHNYLTLLTHEISLLGALLFLGVLVVFIRCSLLAWWRSREAVTRSISLFLFAYFITRPLAVVDGIGPDGYPLSFFFWLFGGLAVALAAQGRVVPAPAQPIHVMAAPVQDLPWRP